MQIPSLIVGRDSTVRIGTRYALDGPRIEFRSGGGGEFFRTRPDRPRGSLRLLHNGYRVIHGGKSSGVWP